MTHWVLWSYVVFMAGAALWFVRWSRDAKGVPRASYWLVVVIIAWSGLWHAIVALGGGQAEVAGRVVHWSVYADWIVTAPLLAIALGKTATLALPDKRWGLISAMVVLNLAMILCGSIADFMAEWPLRLTFYGIGMLALVALFGVIWGPLRAAAMRQPASMASLYKVVASLLSGLWLAFPLAWFLGPSGIGIVGDVGATVVFLALSVLIKVAWSLVDLGWLRVLADRGELSIR